MSIATEISRLQTAKANIKTSIENKGVTVPSSATLDEYPNLIDSISSGSVNLQQKTADPSYSSVVVSPDNNYDGLSQVTVNPIVLHPGVLRPDAELVKTYSYDKYIVDDEGVTIPSYDNASSAQVVLKDTSSESELYTLDIMNYYYLVTLQTLTIPEYSISTVGKGRVEYQMSSAIWEYGAPPNNIFHTLIDPNTYFAPAAGAAVSTLSYSTLYRSIVWNTTTSLTTYTSTSYGIPQITVSPTYTSSETYLTIQTPKFVIRGQSTYLSRTYLNAITDIRYQWVVKIYRVPKNTRYGIYGWGVSSLLTQISNCLDNNTHTLE